MGLYDKIGPESPGQYSVYLASGSRYQMPPPIIDQKHFTKSHPDWRRGSEFEEEAKLLSLFADYPDAPFSIHRFVKHGSESCGKYPGEWFGPSATARCIE